ncbi:hypothetical protein [Chenggangzhangella methanolivorans]|uniref:Uncharacterized protein n=1 Tax=Chenggangzhangella methanolivorans TaxID=1437009 RepID=A0A9E6UP83_9HYPH|nr:hypothetical protein [Chenggangzhangella methanolivorans]QZN99464.1 hypothetical protein K6K41_22495 [Chenggangzhangella methanolivorans]
MDLRERLERLVEIDRPKLYVMGAGIGILLSIIGVWLTPVAADIGRRHMDWLYGVGEATLVAGCALTLLCVVMIVAES